MTDFELLPRSLAEKFREDDLRILRTGVPMLEIVELFISRQGIPAWFLTNKLPVRDRTGEVIGVMGTIQDYAKQRDLLPPDSISHRRSPTSARIFTARFPFPTSPGAAASPSDNSRGSSRNISRLLRSSI